MTGSSEKRVGIIGAGIMGSAMAKNLRHAGFEVFGYDPVPEAQERLRSMGAKALASPREVADAAPIMLLLLPSAAALDAVVGGRDGIAAACRTGQIVVESSTLPLAAKKAALERLEPIGMKMLDCPVSGTGAQAEKKDLVMLGSGEEAVFQKCLEVFEGISRIQRYVGDFGHGSMLKYIANHMITIHNVAAAEAMVLGMKAGIDPALVYETLSDSAATSRMFQVRGPIMRDQNYEEATSTIRLYRKDLSIIDGFAAEHGVALPLYSAASEMYHAGLSLGFGELDPAAVCKVLETLNGIDRSASKSPPK
ncbi:NAD(P)-dependent oxidoreductase [Tardiphaga sp. 866_E4_N2_1]|uniref:NAD(P)-dependent oxidoreductase n=1 Tax=unclassified Tardiphaga TaxID=2631404 RepID=UPI003F1F5534